ncbi:hypothetical protein QBC44DRAFT_7304 [Cladorrhinum sp. PSN332]|nr:hypothetical protein QBC44DRAFT_7304 [Cladorrhinum sp. PSN332]
MMEIICRYLQKREIKSIFDMENPQLYIKACFADHCQPSPTMRTPSYPGQEVALDDPGPAARGESYDFLNAVQTALDLDFTLGALPSGYKRHRWRSSRNLKLLFEGAESMGDPRCAVLENKQSNTNKFAIMTVRNNTGSMEIRGHAELRVLCALSVFGGDTYSISTLNGTEVASSLSRKAPQYRFGPLKFSITPSERVVSDDEI